MKIQKRYNIKITSSINYIICYITVIIDNKIENKFN